LESSMDDIGSDEALGGLYEFGDEAKLIGLKD
jgi:hypothetical protein